MGIMESSFKKRLMKTRQIHNLDSREDSGLKMIQFREGFCIEVIARDVGFPTNPTSFNLELWNSRYR